MKFGCVTTVRPRSASRAAMSGGTTAPCSMRSPGRDPAVSSAAIASASATRVTQWIAIVPRIRRAALIHAINAARRIRGTIAIHCVTRVALALAIAALDTAGSRPGDRIEHGAVVPPDMAARLADLGLTVVTQPNFIRERGDDYLAD